MTRQAAEVRRSELQGSRPWSEEEGRRVVDAWKASGETVAEFARRAGLVAQRVYWWRGRLGAGGGEALARGGSCTLAAVAPSFVPVVVRGPRSSGGGGAATVCTRGGLRVEVAELEGASARWVATLVRSLEEEG